jgi:hypothetical protein
VQHLGNIWADFNRVSGFKNKFKVLFGKPGWLPDSLGGMRKPQIVAADYKKFDTEVPMLVNVYVLVQYALLLAVTSFFLFQLSQFSLTEKVALGSIIFFSSATLGMLLEGRATAVRTESLRLLFTTAALIGLFPQLWSLSFLPLLVLPILFVLWALKLPLAPLHVQKIV